MIQDLQCQATVDKIENESLSKLNNVDMNENQQKVLLFPKVRRMCESQYLFLQKTLYDFQIANPKL